MGLLTGDTLASLALALVIFLLLVDLMHRRVSWAPRYPPGPRALPVLGNLLEFDFQNVNYSMSRLRSRFGDVFTLKMGWTPMVVLNGLVAIREALVHHSEDTSDRFIMPMDTCFGWGPQSQGVIQARYGQAWREQRRFSVSTMRNFGLGKKSLEQWVTEEAGYLCEAFNGHAGRPFSPNVQLNKAVSNVISSLIYARRFEYQDPRFTRMLQLIDTFLKEQSGLLAQVPRDLIAPLRRAIQMALDEALLKSQPKFTGLHEVWGPGTPFKSQGKVYFRHMGYLSESKIGFSGPEQWHK